MTIREKLIQDLGGSDDPARQKLLENSLKAAQGGKDFGHIGPLYSGGRDPLADVTGRWCQEQNMPHASSTSSKTLPSSEAAVLPESPVIQRSGSTLRP